MHYPMKALLISSLALAHGCPTGKETCEYGPEELCPCDPYYGAIQCGAAGLACLDEDDPDWAAHIASCEASYTPGDADTDTDADSDTDTDADADADTDTDPCLHQDHRGNSLSIGTTEKIVTHCHEIGGPDAGMTVGFSSPYKYNSFSQCYEGNHSDPTAAGTIDSDTHWASITSYDPTTYNVAALCPAGDQGIGTWEYEFLPSDGHSCTDYTDEGHGYLIHDLSNPFFHRWEGDAVYGCETGWYYYLTASAYSTSTEIPCVPGSATFDLVPRFMGQANANGETGVIATPIARTDVRFPERAWLRTVSVTDWGDVDELHFTDDVAMFNGDHFLTTTAALAKPNASLALPVGATRMGSRFAVSSVEDGDDLPTITMSWTCEVDPQNPHFTLYQGHTSYIANLTSWGINHRFLFHVDTANKMLRIAPVGRLGDMVQVPFDSNGNFAASVIALNLQFKGKMTQQGNQLLIQQGQVFNGVKYDPVTVNITGELLNPLP